MTFWNTSLGKHAYGEQESTKPSAIVSEVSEEALLKMEVIKSLLEPNDPWWKTLWSSSQAGKISAYSATAAWQMGTLWDAGLTQTERADKGKHRVDEDWQEFILKTYREGNRAAKEKL